jgi:hypothetical protein
MLSVGNPISEVEEHEEDVDNDVDVRDKGEDSAGKFVVRVVDEDVLDGTNGATTFLAAGFRDFFCWLVLPLGPVVALDTAAMVEGEGESSTYKAPLLDGDGNKGIADLEETVASFATDADTDSGALWTSTLPSVSKFERTCCSVTTAAGREWASFITAAAEIFDSPRLFPFLVGPDVKSDCTFESRMFLVHSIGLFCEPIEWLNTVFELALNVDGLLISVRVFCTGSLQRVSSPPAVLYLELRYLRSVLSITRENVSNSRFSLERVDSTFLGIHFESSDCLIAMTSAGRLSEGALSNADSLPSLALLT